MKFLFVLVLAVIASASSYCIRGQKLEACAKQIIRQAEADVGPICDFTFDSIRALVKDAYVNHENVDASEIIKTATDRLSAVVSPAVEALQAILGSDANMGSLYNQLLVDVIEIINNNVAWINKVLDDKSILLSETVALGLLDQSVAYAQIHGHNLNLNLQVQLTGHVNGVIYNAGVKIIKDTPVDPICKSTFNALREATKAAFETGTPLNAANIITKATQDLSAVVGVSADKLSAILVNSIPYVAQYTELLHAVIALINETVGTINAALANPLSSLSSDEAVELVTKCQDDSHQLHEDLLERNYDFLFSSLADF